MAAVEVKLKIRGINKIMTSPEATSLIAQRANRIAASAGPGFEASVVPHRWTARAYIRPVTQAARAREARDKVLARSLSAGG